MTSMAPGTVFTPAVVASSPGEFEEEASCEKWQEEIAVDCSIPSVCCHRASRRVGTATRVGIAELDAAAQPVPNSGEVSRFHWIDARRHLSAATNVLPSLARFSSRQLASRTIDLP